MAVLNYRKYARVEVEIPIEVLERGAAEETWPAEVSNLNEEGASLRCTRPLTIATTLEFNLPLIPGEPPVHVTGDILWSKPVNEAGQQQFAHGLLFSRLLIADRDRLHRFISQSMNY